MLNALIFQQQQLMLEQRILQTQAQIDAQAALLRGMSMAQQQPQAVRKPVAQVRKVNRQPLGEVGNTMWGEEEEEEGAGDMKGLIARERLARNKISRLALTEAARLEMQLQNLNIKKNSNRGEEGVDANSSSFFTTPKKDQSPQVIERETTSDGQVIYDFKPGTPGGMCVYFLKGFCSLGNKCRYVHDETDDGRFVKVTGMPYDVTVDKIIEFFSPLKIRPENVMFITPNGKPTGSAIIEFLDRKEALLSQSKDRSHITEQRYVLLYPSSRKEKMWHMSHAMKVVVPQSCGTPMRGTPGSGLSMGLTPSPMLSIGGNREQAAGHREVDHTTRSLLSTLNEADEESPKKAVLSPIGTPAVLEPPPLIKRMNADDWLTHLQLSLKTSTSNQSIPSLVTAPHSYVESALAGLGYNSVACNEILKALQEINTKSKLPFQNPDFPADMPSLLPLNE
eukprot:TRINITY_DN635_c0_g1_i1.p1 TRINITY_DN635_c0_g1~~TRINITY_DN635_c0_g1_i1.p1  ORF type:complete len:469 (+),score=142.49 TRINITY_DN635_c0_g1_i1:56-1408(+)